MKNETKTSAEKVVKETVKQPKPKLMNIKLEKLHPFENHPYRMQWLSMQILILKMMFPTILLMPLGTSEIFV